MSKQDDKKEKLEQKIGECIGLEMAAQKAVQELSAKGLLDKRGMLSKLKSMQKEAGNHQSKLEQVVEKLSGSLDSATINQAAQETELKASEMMKTYLGTDPDSSEAIEFLCLAEGGEVTHYEVLAALAKKVKLNSKQLSNTISSILKQEQRHLKLCTKLAKEAAAY
jgi:protein-disulfide isomerase-like protein with CxxC motif